MNVVHDSRSDAYREEMQYAVRKRDVPAWHFYNANLSLDELKQHTHANLYGAEGPSEADFDHVRHRFERAVVAAEEAEDIPRLLHTRLTMAYIKPIVLADVINMDSLKGAKARHAFVNIGLDQAVEEAYTIAADALVIHDELSSVPRGELSEKDEYDLRHVVGFLGEVTPLLFYGGRHRTSKRFATPALAYDDMLAPDHTRRIDIDLYDNQVDRKKARHSFQMKTSISEHSKEYDPEIPVLYAADFGNDKYSSEYWSRTEKSFMAVRLLLHEHEGILRPELVSRLDRIASDAFKKINAPMATRLLSAGKFGAHSAGVEMARFLRGEVQTPEEHKRALETIKLLQEHPEETDVQDARSA